MNINRHNYEEFFILYADNELDQNGKEQVELFIQHNPDLADELDILQQSKFTPDTDIVFEGKESLMKAMVNPSLTLDNPEEWLLLYTDNELSPEQRITVERYIAANPAAKKELELFQITKLQAEPIVFPNKASLYRREENVRVISIRWRRIAAAAVLFIAISTVAFIMFNKEKGYNESLAERGKVDTKQLPANPVKGNETINSEPVTDPVITNYSSNNKLAEVRKSDSNIPLKKEEMVSSTIAMIDAQQTVTSDKENTFVPNMKADKQASVDFAYNIPTPKELTENNQSSPVTLDSDPSFNFAKATAIDDPEAEQSKGTVRGFLRRVTRTIEKTTNIKATDDDDRLLVGGLAVKL